MLQGRSPSRKLAGLWELQPFARESGEAASVHPPRDRGRSSRPRSPASVTSAAPSNELGLEGTEETMKCSSSC